MDQDQEQAAVMEPAVVPDAIALLTADHRKARTLFDEYDRVKDNATPEEKFEIAKAVCGDLLIHLAIEEGIFYPAVRKGIDDEKLLDEAESEHNGAKEIIIELGDTKPDDPKFDDRMTVLAERIEHHVREEESQMFPKILASKLDIRQLGEELFNAKQDMRRRLGLPAE